MPDSESLERTSTCAVSKNGERTPSVFGHLRHRSARFKLGAHLLDLR